MNLIQVDRLDAQTSKAVLTSLLNVFPLIGKNTFVPITSSSRLPYSRSHRPVTSSLTPTEYMSAVSKKLIPASMARLKNGADASASCTHGRHSGVP